MEYKLIIKPYDGKNVQEGFLPVPEEKIQIKEESKELIYEGVKVLTGGVAWELRETDPRIKASSIEIIVKID